MAASVNFATERASLRYDPRVVDLDELLSAVAATGYRAALPTAEARQLHRRLVLPVALSLPVVLIAMVGPLQCPGGSGP